MGGPQWSRMVLSASINKLLKCCNGFTHAVSIDSCTYKNCEIATATTVSRDEAACVIDTPIMVASVNIGRTVLKNYPVNRFIYNRSMVV